jgi:hypothetical protein
MTNPSERLTECLRLLDAKDYFNGGQTVRARYPLGSEERARIIAEAAFWQSQIGATFTD